MKDPPVAVWTGAGGAAADQGGGPASIQVGDDGGPDQGGGREETGVWKLRLTEFAEGWLCWETWELRGTRVRRRGCAS